MFPPGRLFMNRQVITLLSQCGISDEVFLQLQEDHLHNLMETLTSNSNACVELDKINIDIPFRSLYKNGVDLVSDPFFRSLLMVRYEEDLRSLLFKTRIPIPPSLGRLLMGVADETGILLSGQIFIRYSSDVDKSDGEISTVGGPVTVTKNPCFHPGDLRVFEAVDHVELHHMVDCIVFPIHGERPHPNEMSGSDLDGDLYWATWHHDLIITKNNPPMHFPKARKSEINHEPRQEDIIEYIGDYIKNDQLGTIANAHLVQADLEDNGVFSDKCNQLAELHSIAVDFSKTGVFPEVNPDLRPKRYPDFMMKKEQDQYDSVRVLGKLHRNASQLWEAFRLQQETSNQSGYSDAAEPAPDLIPPSSITVACYEKALDHYNAYALQMQRLIDTYGLDDESHVLAGSAHKIKQNTLHKGDRHELAIIMKAQVRKLRSQYVKVLKADNDTGDLTMMALAWHEVSYRDCRFRSFGWLAHSNLPSNVCDSEMVAFEDIEPCQLSIHDRLTQAKQLQLSNQQPPLSDQVPTPDPNQLPVQHGGLSSNPSNLQLQVMAATSFIEAVHCKIARTPE